MLGDIQFIAEVKTQSPFGWQSPKSWDELFALANQHGDIISIHTDSRWGGSLELVARARVLTDKPILAKGIHASDDDIAAALEAGANYVLVVGRSPKIKPEVCWIEPDSLADLSKLAPQTKVVWNSRNLKNGGFKMETFGEARTAFPGWLCQASNIKIYNDIASGANAILVGQYLPEFIASLPA